jgi:RNase P subunit RPR2
MKKFSKSKTEKRVKDFFGDMKKKSPTEVRKIKKLAMNQNIPLKEKRKLFCKFCLTPYSGKEKVRIKDKIKSIECPNCKKISRWKIKN